MTTTRHRSQHSTMITDQHHHHYYHHQQHYLKSFEHILTMTAVTVEMQHCHHHRHQYIETTNDTQIMSDQPTVRPTDRPGKSINIREQ